MAQWIGSPNFDTSRKPIDRVVIHWFGAGNQAGADAQFQKPNGTSAHYSVEDSSIHQYVKEEHTAYHAGVYAMNQRSIGIEHSATPDRPATEATYQTAGKLLGEICRRYNIPFDRSHIIKHSEVPKATQCCGTIDIDKLITIAQGAPMSEIDELKKKVAAYEIEVEAKNKQIGEYEKQVKGLQDFAKDEYQRGYKNGQLDAQDSPTPVVGWEENGLTIETTNGNEKRIVNYKRK